MSRFIEKYNCCVVSFKDIIFKQILPTGINTILSSRIQGSDSPRRVKRSNTSLQLQPPEFFLHFSNWGFQLCVWYSKLKISHIDHLLVSTEFLLCAQVNPGRWSHERHSFVAALVMTNTCKITVTDTNERMGVCLSTWCLLKASGKKLEERQII